MTFESFVLTSSLRNAWVREPGLSIYVRRARFRFGKSVVGSPTRAGTDFDLASGEADHPGSGALTRFLDKYEPQYRFYIENILSDRLVTYFARRGYQTCPYNSQCMKGPKQ